MFYCYVHGEGENGYLNFHAWQNKFTIERQRNRGYTVEIIGKAYETDWCD